MRKFVVSAIAVFVVATGYAFKTAISSSTAAGFATPAANTLSPYQIHVNYKGMKDLPVHDSTNAF